MDEASGFGERPRSGCSRVVVGVDGSEGCKAALAQAAIVATRRGARLTVVSAFPVESSWADSCLPDPGQLDAVRAQTETRVRQLVAETLRASSVARVGDAAQIAYDVVVVAGAPAEQLIRLAEGADVLVVGSRGRGAVSSMMLGSVALHCSTYALCPVLVVHPAPVATSARVVVGLDQSDTSRAALRRAVGEAVERGAAVEAVVAFRMGSVWIRSYALMALPVAEVRRRVLQGGREIVDHELGEDCPVQVQVLAEEGRAGDVLVDHSTGAEVLVVGSRSRSRLTGMILGSTALHCVVHAHCPVLVVHPAHHDDHEDGTTARVAAEH